jgi:signal transduction histidine kinase/CheY-like chemotaxis protein
MPKGAKRIPEAAAVGVALILVLTGWLGSRYLNQAEWVRHSLEVETKIASIWSLLQDAEVGQRSYVLTGDDRFLEPFHHSSKQIAGELDQLAALVADNPKQVSAVAEVKPLVDQRLRFAEDTIALRRAGDFEGARNKVLEGTGLRLMLSLRDRFEDLQATETELLDSRIAASRTTVSLLIIAILVSLAAVIGALATWIMASRRSNQILAHTNAALAQTIAEREAAELQLRQMQKMEAVGQLTGGIAHDFNNMLAVIMSGLGLAQRRMSDGDTVGASRYVDSALEGAQRAATLIKRLLAFARQQPLAPEAVDANKLVSSMSELVARSLGGSIRTETILGGGLWKTMIDPAQLENSILNLCVNARDAMPEGGRLTVETANCHLDDRYSRLHAGVPPGQYVLIAVSDTGSGMPPEVLAKAFDPFFTTKETGKGTGLGLSQVFGFVKQSGGHVKIYSELGQGTTLKIYLPRYYGAETDHQPANTPLGPDLKGVESILLVEDDDSVLQLTSAGLRDLGYTVLEAKHADEAVKHLVNGATVDLMLTDIVMPDINGRKLAEKATSLRPGLKVLFMTGFTKNAVVHNGMLDAGVNFLAKPFTLEELARKLREVLDAEIKD